VRWEHFNWIELVGFIGIVIGILVYNRIWKKSDNDSYKPIGDEEKVIKN